MKRKPGKPRAQADKGCSLPHDRIWMCEALTNLLKNAVEHSACTEIVIRLTALPGAVKLCVCDNGQGILLQEIPHLFDRFRVRPGSEPQNTGIGMAIAKEVFRAHGGAVTVWSQPGSTEIMVMMHPQATKPDAEGASAGTDDGSRISQIPAAE